MQAKGGEAESKIFDPGFQPRVRPFSLEYTQLLTEGEDLQAEAVTGTEEGFEEDEQADQKRNHRPGFIS